MSLFKSPREFALEREIEILKARLNTLGANYNGLDLTYSVLEDPPIVVNDRINPTYIRLDIVASGRIERNREGLNSTHLLVEAYDPEYQIAYYLEDTALAQGRQPEIITTIFEQMQHKMMDDYSIRGS